MKTTKQKTMIRKFRNSSNFELLEKDKEQVKGDSMTVPDDSYTIRELLYKFTKGYGINEEGLMRNGQLGSDETDHDDEDLEKVLCTDLVEQEETVSSYHEIHRQIEEKQRKRLEKAAQEKAEKMKKFEEWEKAQKIEKEKPKNEIENE